MNNLTDINFNITTRMDGSPGLFPKGVQEIAIDVCCSLNPNPMGYFRLQLGDGFDDRTHRPVKTTPDALLASVSTTDGQDLTEVINAGTVVVPARWIATSGSGTGLVLSYTSTAAAITSITVTNGGANYQVGDTVTIAGDTTPVPAFWISTSGIGTGLELKYKSTTTHITSITVTKGGANYHVGDTLTVKAAAMPGRATDAKFTLVEGDLSLRVLVTTEDALLASANTYLEADITAGTDIAVAANLISCSRPTSTGLELKYTSSATHITSITVTAGGEHYHVDDTLTIDAAAMPGRTTHAMFTLVEDDLAPRILVTTLNALVFSMSTEEGESLVEPIDITTQVVAAGSITTTGGGTGLALIYVAAASTHISSMTVTDGGSGYFVGDTVTIAHAAMPGRTTDAVFTLVDDDLVPRTVVTAADALVGSTDTYLEGAITDTSNVVAAGSISATGSGTGLELSYRSSATHITSITVTASGTGYQVGNVITIDAAAMDGRSTAAKFALVEDDFGSSVVTAVDALKGSSTNLVDAAIEAGTAVVVAAGSITTSGSGSGLALVYTSNTAEITSITVTAGGSGYKVGDTVTIAVAATPTRTAAVVFTLVADDLDTRILVTTPDALMGSASTTAGEDLVEDIANRDAVVVINNNGAGTYTVAVTSGGTGYVDGNTIVILGSKLGGIDTINDCTLTVTGESGDTVLVSAELVATGTAPTTIKGVSSTMPPRVRAVGHPFSANDLVIITGVEGMREVNGIQFRVARPVTVNTFALLGADGTAWTGYLGGGVVSLVTSVTIGAVVQHSSLHHGWGDGVPRMDAAVSTLGGANHPFRVRDKVKITGVAGMAELNGGIFTISSTTPVSFNISGVDTIRYGAYLGGGTATLVSEAVVTGIDASAGEVTACVVGQPFRDEARVRFTDTPYKAYLDTAGSVFSVARSTPFSFLISGFNATRLAAINAPINGTLGLVSLSARVNVTGLSRDREQSPLTVTACSVGHSFHKSDWVSAHGVGGASELNHNGLQVRVMDGVGQIFVKAPTATLSGETIKAVHEGVATFDDLRVDKAGPGNLLIMSHQKTADATSTSRKQILSCTASAGYFRLDVGGTMSPRIYSADSMTALRHKLLAMPGVEAVDVGHSSGTADSPVCSNMPGSVVEMTFSSSSPTATPPTISEIRPSVQACPAVGLQSAEAFISERFATITGMTPDVTSVVTTRTPHGLTVGDNISITGVNGFDITRYRGFPDIDGEDNTTLYQGRTGWAWGHHSTHGTAHPLHNSSMDNLVNGRTFQVVAIQSTYQFNISANLTTSDDRYISGGIVAFEAVTREAQCKVVSVGHTMQPGHRVKLTGLTGMEQLNNREFRVGDVTATTFALLDALTLANLDTSDTMAYPTPYLKGGKATLNGANLATKGSNELEITGVDAATRASLFPGDAVRISSSIPPYWTDDYLFMAWKGTSGADASIMILNTPFPTDTHPAVSVYRSAVYRSSESGAKITSAFVQQENDFEVSPSEPGVQPLPGVFTLNVTNRTGTMTAVLSVLTTTDALMGSVSTTAGEDLEEAIDAGTTVVEAASISATGSGTGLALKYASSTTVITSITVTAVGSGYHVGDVITIDASAMPGRSTAAKFTLVEDDLAARTVVTTVDALVGSSANLGSEAITAGTDVAVAASSITATGAGAGARTGLALKYTSTTAAITSITVTSGGSGYHVGDTVTIAVAATPTRTTAVVFTLVENDLAPRTVVTTTDALVGSVSTTPGEDLEEVIAASTTDVAAGSISASGTGTGLAISYASSTTHITCITVTAGGSGYQVGDVVTIAAAGMPGRSTDAVFTLVADDLVPIRGDFSQHVVAQGSALSEDIRYQLRLLDRVRIHSTGEECRVAAWAGTTGIVLSPEGCGTPMPGYDAHAVVISRLFHPSGRTLTIQSDPAAATLLGTFTFAPGAASLTTSVDQRRELSPGDTVVLAPVHPHASQAVSVGRAASVINVQVPDGAFLVETVTATAVYIGGRNMAWAYPGLECRARRMSSAAGTPLHTQPVLHVTDNAGNLASDDFVSASLHHDRRVQSLVCDATGGSFTLSLEGTTSKPILAGANASHIQSVLRALPGAAAAAGAARTVVVIGGGRPRIACTSGGHTSIIVHVPPHNGTFTVDVGLHAAVSSVSLLAPDGAQLTGGARSLELIVPTGKLSGATTVPVVSGIAAFKDLAVTGVGSAGRGYRLQFNTFPGGLPLSAPVRSPRFDVFPGDPARLRFRESTTFAGTSAVPLRGVPVGRPLDHTTAVVVNVEDAAGNVVADDSQALFSVDLVQADAASVLSISQDMPAVVRATRHPFAVGDSVVFEGVRGMSKLNGQMFVIANTSNSSGHRFELEHSPGVPTDTRAAQGYSEYTEGGTVRRVGAAVKRDAQSYKSLDPFERYAAKGVYRFRDLDFGTAGPAYALSMRAATRPTTTSSGAPCRRRGKISEDVCVSPALHDGIPYFGCISDPHVTGLTGGQPGCATQVDARTGAAVGGGTARLLDPVGGGGVTGTITKIATGPTITTLQPHGLAEGTRVVMYRVGGMIELNGLEAAVGLVVGQPSQLVLTGLDTSAFGTHTAGTGMVVRAFEVHALSHVTQAEAAVVTTGTQLQPFLTGDQVRLQGAGGMPGLNSHTFVVGATGLRQFQLAGADTRSFGAYEAGTATARRVRSAPILGIDSNLGEGVTLHLRRGGSHHSFAENDKLRVTGAKGLNGATALNGRMFNVTVVRRFDADTVHVHIRHMDTDPTGAEAAAGEVVSFATPGDMFMHGAWAEHVELTTIAGVTMGTTTTVSAPGHPFAQGQYVRLDGINARADLNWDLPWLGSTLTTSRSTHPLNTAPGEDRGVFRILSATLDAFTVDSPVSTTFPPFAAPTHGWEPCLEWECDPIILGAVSPPFDIVGPPAEVQVRQHPGDELLEAWTGHPPMEAPVRGFIFEGSNILNTSSSLLSRIHRGDGLMIGNRSVLVSLHERLDADAVHLHEPWNGGADGVAHFGQVGISTIKRRSTGGRPLAQAPVVALVDAFNMTVADSTNHEVSALLFTGPRDPCLHTRALLGASSTDSVATQPSLPPSQRVGDAVVAASGGLRSDFRIQSLLCISSNPRHGTTMGAFGGAFSVSFGGKVSPPILHSDDVATVERRIASVASDWKPRVSLVKAALVQTITAAHPAVVHTKTPHGFAVGERIRITGVPDSLGEQVGTRRSQVDGRSYFVAAFPPGNNKAFYIGTALYTIKTAAQIAATDAVLVTTNSAHALAVGNIVALSGIGTHTALHHRTLVVTSVPSATTFAVTMNVARAIVTAVDALIASASTSAGEDLVEAIDVSAAAVAAGSISATGAGTGLALSYVSSTTAITSITVTASGSGYQVGDVVTIAVAAMAGRSTAAKFALVEDDFAGSVVTTADALVGSVSTATGEGLTETITAGTDIAVAAANIATTSVAGTGLALKYTTAGTATYTCTIPSTDFTGNTQASGVVVTQATSGAAGTLVTALTGGTETAAIMVSTNSIAFSATGVLTIGDFVATKTPTVVVVSATSISSITATNAGSGYAVGDTITIATAGMPGRGTAAKFTLVADDLDTRILVTTTDALIASASTSAGEDLVEAIDVSATAVAAGSISATGAGSGLELTYISSATAITSITVTAGGSGYHMGDTVTIAAAAMPGRSTDAIFTLVEDDLVPVVGLPTAPATLTATAATAGVTDNSANSDAVVVINNNGAGIYTLAVTNGGTGYVDGNTIVILGSKLGGIDTINDCTLTVTGESGDNVLVSAELVATGIAPTGKGGAAVCLLDATPLRPHRAGTGTVAIDRSIMVDHIYGIGGPGQLQIEAPGHPFSLKTRVRFSSVAGLTALNGKVLTVVRANGVSFTVNVPKDTLWSMNRTLDAHVTQSGRYTGGGVATEVLTVLVTAIHRGRTTVVVAPAHHFDVGDHVRLAGIDGMPELDGGVFLVFPFINASSFEIRHVTHTPLDSTRFPPAFTSGSTGTATKVQAINVTSITRGNPPVVTAEGHPFHDGWSVLLSGVPGMQQVNGRVYRVTAAVAGKTFALEGADSTAFDAYQRSPHHADGLATAVQGGSMCSEDASVVGIVDMTATSGGDAGRGGSVPPSKVPPLRMAASRSQRIICRAFSGNFALTFLGDTTEGINADDTAAHIKSKLAALPSVESVHVMILPSPAQGGSGLACDGASEIIVTFLSVRGFSGYEQRAADGSAVPLMVTPSNGGGLARPFTLTVAHFNIAPNPTVAPFALHATGGVTRRADRGFVSFDGLGVDKACDNHVIQLIGLGGNAASSIKTRPFRVTAGAPARLRILTQPAYGHHGKPLLVAPKVELVDAGGNRVVNVSFTVTVSISTNPSRAALNSSAAPRGWRTLIANSRGMVAVGVRGVADFAPNMLRISTPGQGFTLRFDARGPLLPTPPWANDESLVVDSKPFDVSGPPAILSVVGDGANLQLGARSGRALSMQVAVLDAQRVPCARNYSHDRVVVSIDQNADCPLNCATLTGDDTGGTLEVQPSARGIATFSGIVVTLPGARALSTIAEVQTIRMGFVLGAEVTGTFRLV